MYFFIGDSRAPGFIHTWAIVPELGVSFALFSRYSWAKNWAQVYIAIALLAYFGIPLFMIWVGFFDTKYSQDFLESARFARNHWFPLIVFNSIYGLFYGYVSLILSRPQIQALFQK